MASPYSPHPAVADEGSITAAAERVRVAQPSLSRQLRSLEAELGVELFTRSGRSVRLSPAGRRFLPIVRDLVARADGARAAMTALARGTRVELTVAAHPTTIADVIAPLVAERGLSTERPVVGLLEPTRRSRTVPSLAPPRSS